MVRLPGRLTHAHNPNARPGECYPDHLKDTLSTEAANQAIQEIRLWPGYSVTPLHALSALAANANLAKIWYKDESQRFSLKSFKALGGAFAVARQLQQRIEENTRRMPRIEDLLDGKCKQHCREITISCATAGNHGRSVAWGCQMFGCGCVIYVHQDVSEGRKRAMESFGAKVIRVSGNYEQSVRQADRGAREHGRIIVSDTSYEGHMDIPKDVALGYTAMLSEIVGQLAGDIPTHVFIQGGVGGLASAVCGYFWDLWGLRRPRMVVVEPERANCLQESCRAGKMVTVEGDLDTLMAGLACGRVSHLAWDILSIGADDFTTVSEDAVPATMRLLAAGHGGAPQIEAGESAVAGVAGLTIASNSDEYRQRLGLCAESKVLVIGTEGATDPEIYEKLVTGYSPGD